MLKRHYIDLHRETESEGGEREGIRGEREEGRGEREGREGGRGERVRKRGEREEEGRERGRNRREREGRRDKNMKGKGLNCFHNKLIPRMPSVCHIDLSPWNTLLYWKFPLCRKGHTWKLVLESYSHLTVSSKPHLHKP